jgi:hypothetical protein
VSYRDDHDAAIARADALEHELRHAYAERDRFKAELETRRPEQAEADTTGDVDVSAGVVLGVIALVMLFVLALSGGQRPHHAPARAPSSTYRG